MKNHHTVLMLFGVVVMVHLTGIVLNHEMLQLYSKPLIMILLMIYYGMAARQRSYVFITAMLFCWAGDVLLMFQHTVPYCFLLGLGAFLIGHLLYIMAYLQHRKEDTGSGFLPTQKIRYAMPFLLAGTGLLTVLYPNLASLLWPVVAYAVVLVTMVIVALFRYGRTSAASFGLVFGGAVLFMISDSLLAMNKFHAPIQQAGLLIMITYCLAQGLIAEGMLRHEAGSSMD
ncbi:MAG TPA: lysoplasmalogenase [Cyclobacteriaceae bacterium]|nr:lysoplasmalogenase [Cyclobacteriaceae bacterium]